MAFLAGALVGAVFAGIATWAVTSECYYQRGLDDAQSEPVEWRD